MLRLIVSAAALVFVLGAFASILNSKPASSLVSSNSTASVIPVVPLPVEGLTIASWKWSIAGFGNVALATFTLKNAGRSAVKDVTINCSFYGPSGSIASTASVRVLVTIPAGKSKTSKELNLGFIDQQSVRANCRIVDASWA